MSYGKTNVSRPSNEKHMCIYIYIERERYTQRQRERERERERDVHRYMLYVKKTVSPSRQQADGLETFGCCPSSILRIIWEILKSGVGITFQGSYSMSYGMIKSLSSRPSHHQADGLETFGFPHSPYPTQLALMARCRRV